MSTVAHVQLNPSNEEWLQIKVPPQSSILMGRFQPALWNTSTKRYDCHANHLDAFLTFAKLNDIHVLDARTAPTSPPQGSGWRPLPECHSCGQPAHRDAVLRFCPACGLPWRPLTHDAEAQTTNDLHAYRECPNCQTRQRGRFAHCQHCGGQLEATDDVSGNTPRRKLDEPTKLSDLLDAWTQA